MGNFTEDQLKYYIKLLAAQLADQKIKTLPDKRLHQITLGDLADCINAPGINHEQRAI